MRAAWTKTCALLGTPLLGSLAGCGVQLPTPRIAAVEPIAAFNGQDTQIVITGEQFFPKVDIGSGNQSDVDPSMTAWLDADGEIIALDHVILVDTEHVSAVVPAGHAADTYTLVVSTPSGRVAELEGFTITASAAQAFGVAHQDATAQGEASVTIRVLDDAGMPVADAIGVKISRTLGAPVTFCDDCLADSALGADSVSGTIEGGSATVTLQLVDPTVAGTAQLMVESTDPLLRTVLQPVVDQVTFTSRTVEGLDVSVLDSAGTTLTKGDAVAAGEPLTVMLTPIDANGEPIAEAHGWVALYERCGTGTPVHKDVDGPTIVPGVALTSAECETNGFDVIGEIENSLDLDASAPASSPAFEVRPGPAVRYGVEADGPLESGLWPAAVDVEALDTYGNVAVDHNTLSLALELTNTVLSKTEPFDRVVCAPFDDGRTTCVARLCPGVVPAFTVGLVSVSSPGLSGHSDSIGLQAGPPLVDPQITLGSTDLTFELGDTVDVSVSLGVPFGHPIVGALADDDVVSASWSNASCAFRDLQETKKDFVVSHYTCTFNEAGTGKLVAQIDDYCLFLQSPMVTVGSF